MSEHRRVLAEQGLRVFGGKPEDLFTSWRYLQDVAAKFFSDLHPVSNMTAWKRFCDLNIYDACVARNSRGEICCVAYTTRQTPRSLTFHAFSGPPYRTPLITLPAATLAIEYFFQAHNLVRLDTVGRWDNRMARMVATKLGFQPEGRLRSFLPHDGVWKDYYLASIVRSA